MESPRQPPYDVSELEEWLQGVRIYRNPGRDDPGFLDSVMLHPNLDYYSATIEWDNSRTTRILARKQTCFPIRSKCRENLSLGIGPESYWEWFWDNLNISRLVQPYFARTATFDPALDAAYPMDDKAACYLHHREREGHGYPNGPSKKIFKLMKRMYEAQK